ncbi:hypothetical protein AGABI2DRAFT_196626 [Agaricus bisporus var. bisporus H97]|uniref:hypothetical protein n=1 Tax=Agaricus bisporus var. bisporus (strain H97 / ATCC MYA-4626 / FGSC 10389) TaxID=936046 RepID=UPI00029F6BC4|nr:hypothetical protein AGABI2DRAFT_196626 [Agaricus bisporus var. bisporus H97]EKV51007.1 hypothetical protein AGABI2DRAFT_196626 [Agaricus bisporus var. bisporus H97]
MSTHTAIATTAKGVVHTLQVPTEEPQEDEVLVKVEYSAVIPPEVYMVDSGKYVEQYPVILGFTVSGTVMKVGSNIKDLKPTDRVTTFSYGPSRYKGIQQYAVQPRSVCAKACRIPGNLSFDAAATIPDNFACAFYILFNQLSLPMPLSLPTLETPPLANSPILIYGAGSTAGQYMTRLLYLARYKNIIATASAKHHEYLRSLGATHVFDYRSSTLIEDINNVVGGSNKLTMVVDCISATTTMNNIAKVLKPTGTVALLMPVKKGTTLNVDEESDLITTLPLPDQLNPFGEKANVIGVRTFFYQEDTVLKERLLPAILPELLEKGLIEAPRYRIMDQGSLQQRAEQALELLRTNQLSGEKVIVKVSD